MMNKELGADKCCLTLINMTLTLCSESCKGFKGEVKLSLKGHKNEEKAIERLRKKGSFLKQFTKNVRAMIQSSASIVSVGHIRDVAVLEVA